MQQNYPKVSILSSSYNHIQFIDEFIESVFAQDYPNFELIMIDDGSKDGCGQRLKELSEKYNFKSIIRENKGFPNALNTLRPLATGEYTVIIAADDKMVENRLSQQVEFLEKNKNLALVASDMQEIDEVGKLGNLVSRPFANGNVFDQLLLSELYLLAPTVMIRTSALNEVGEYDESLDVEDFDMWLRLAKVFDFGFLNIKATYYRIHSGNSHGNYKKSYEQKRMVLEKYKDHSLFTDAYRNFVQGSFLYLSRFKDYQDLAADYKIEGKRYGIMNKTYLKGLIKYYFMSKI